VHWGWLFFAAFVEAIVTYIAMHWDSDLAPLVTIFGVATALPFLLILIVGFINIQANPGNADVIAGGMITATVSAFVNAAPSALVGDIAGIVVGAVFGLFTGSGK
jgi:membrane protein YqaA with SNARE-associated domain